MVDYINRKNEIPICTDYRDIRRMRLDKPIYPQSVLAMSMLPVMNNQKRKAGLKQFLNLKFNIIESIIRNVI